MALVLKRCLFLFIVINADSLIQDYYCSFVFKFMMSPIKMKIKLNMKTPDISKLTLAFKASR